MAGSVKTKRLNPKLEESVKTHFKSDFVSPTEIGQYRIKICIKKDIIELKRIKFQSEILVRTVLAYLNISMSNLVLVKVLESSCDRTEPSLGIPLTKWTILAYDIADVAVRRKVHDDVYFGARPKELLDVNAVGVLQVVHYLQLSFQVIVKLLAVWVLNVHHLDGKVLAVLDALVHWWGKR